MGEEIQSLKVNYTLTLTTLPKGQKAAEGKWVYSFKTDIDSTNTNTVQR